MIEVVIDSIRVSLTSQQRLVMLRDSEGDRQLPIWIGAWEADSIALELQETEFARPLTHDLVKNIIEQMGGEVTHMVVNELTGATFKARLHIKCGEEMYDIDCRPSDAIAISVRAKVPIFVMPEVMNEAAILPEVDI
ncbi:MAG: bifunctional nuclease family protein, partial [Methylococcales bacterium]|nr:bifunctional nuclease family protein [Methylococcales bacterium]